MPLRFLMFDLAALLPPSGRYGALAVKGTRLAPSSLRSGSSCLPTRLRATPRFAAAESSGIRGLRPRFVDGKAVAPKLIFIQLCDRLLRLVLGAHLNEHKPTRAPRGHVAHHFHRFHGAGAGAQVLELRFARFIREISDIQLSTHDLTPLPRNATSTPTRRTVSTASKGHPWSGISSRS